MQSFSFPTAFIRSFSNPADATQKTYTLLVGCSQLPASIPNDPNARQPTKLNSKVYRGVRESLAEDDGLFHFKNKGIILVASKVEVKQRIGKNPIVTVHFEEGEGIVDGGHTYQIIKAATGDISHQYVMVTIHQGLDENFIVEMSRGLNTSMQVKESSLTNLNGGYDWVKEALGSKSDQVAYAESDSETAGDQDIANVDIREVLAIMEALKFEEYVGSRHPKQAATGSGVIVNRYSAEFNSETPTANSFYPFKNILKDCVLLMDLIRYDFYAMYNRNSGSNAGGLKLLNKSREPLHFLKGELKNSPVFRADAAAREYTLYRTAAMPILAAFRVFLVKDKSGMYAWMNGFADILRVWNESGSEVALRLKALDHRNPDALAKDINSWTTVYDLFDRKLLEAKIKMLESR